MPVSYDLGQTFDIGTNAFRLPPSDWLRGFMFIYDRVESPIEQDLGWALVNRLLHLQPLFSLRDTEKPEENIVLIPQYHWKSYRIDFAVCWQGRRVFVECDGHEFHERTKAQAEHDRAKDRAIQASGIGILRFTGSEINRDAYECADEIMSFCWERLRASR